MKTSYHSKLHIASVFYIALFLAPAFAAAQTEVRHLLINQGEVVCAISTDVPVAIDAATGNLKVQVSDLETCIPQVDALALSPVLVTPATVQAGSSFDLVWTSVGAASCAIQLPSGWTNSSGAPGTSGIARITVASSTTAGSYPLAVDCLDAQANALSQSASIGVTVPDPQTPPATPSLTRTVVQGTAPGEIRLDWSASSGASSCTAESSPVVSQWNGSVGTGTNQQTILSGLAAGSYTFRLRCANSAGTSANAQVTASISAPANEACANRAPPEGWERMSTGSLSCVYPIGALSWDSSADCRTWTPGIWPTPFLETGGLTFRLGTRQPRQYLAIALDTNGLTSLTSGSITSSEPGGTPMVNPRRIYSISSCPGDFHQDAVMADTGCYGQLTGLFHIFWGGPGTTRACKLQSNRTYYLNIIATDDPLGTPPNQIRPAPECETSACGATYSPQVTLQ